MKIYQIIKKLILLSVFIFGCNSSLPKNKIIYVNGWDKESKKIIDKYCLAEKYDPAKGGKIISLSNENLDNLIITEELNSYYNAPYPTIFVREKIKK